MRKTLIPFILAIIVALSWTMIASGASPHLGPSEPLDPKDTLDSQDTGLTLMNSDPTGITLCNTLAGSDILDSVKSFDGQDYRWLDVERYKTTNISGSPRLPIREALLAIPNGVDLSLKIIETSNETSTGEIVAPLPEPTFQTQADGSITAQFVYDPDETCYARDAFYPTEVARITAIQNIRDQRIVRIEFYPFRYNPTSKTLCTYSSITVRLVYSFPATIEIVPVGPLDEVLPSLLLNGNDTSNLTQFSTSNPKGSGSGSSPTPPSGVSYPINPYDSNNSADYLIITADPFYAAALYDFDHGTTYDPLNNLAFWRAEHNGFDVAVVNIEDIAHPGPPDEDLKNFITYVYENWSSAHMSDRHVGYILLVGDTESVPAHEDFDGGDLYVADSWFTAVTVGDTMPDIPIGRFSVDVKDKSELPGIAFKTVDYENSIDLEPWRKKVLMSLDKENQMFREYDFMKNIFITNSGYTVSEAFKIYGHGSEEVIEYINDGRIIVQYYGHGAWNGWLIGFDDYTINYLNNDDKCPIVIAIACNTACFQIQNPFDCFGELLVNKTDGGAVAYYGSSINTSALNSTYYDYLQSVFESHQYILGHNIMDMIIESNNAYPEYNLLGDPVLDFSGKTGYPDRPDLTLAHTDITLSPEHPTVDDPHVDVSTRVWNLGGDDAYNIWVRVNAETRFGFEELIGEVLIDEIPAGDSEIINVRWTLDNPIGTWFVTAEVDVTNKVTESFELNNQAGVFAATFWLDTVHVDANNTQSPWNGTSDYPYQHIQDGVDNVSEGGTILVRSGLYESPNSYQIEVDRPMFIIGEDPANTVIDAQGAERAFSCTSSSGMAISRLRIINANEAVYLDNCPDSLVAECDIEGETRGIYLFESDCACISGNRISADTCTVIGKTDSSLIAHNLILDATVEGIDLNSSNDNMLERNLFTNCTLGVMVDNAENEPAGNHFTLNNFIDNETHALADWDNFWNNAEIGNCWDDYTSPPPYEIFGGEGSNFDYHPLNVPLDISRPQIEFPVQERTFTVTFGDDLGGPGDDRLDIIPYDDVSSWLDMEATLYVKGSEQTIWKFKKLMAPMTMPVNPGRYRGHLTQGELEAFYLAGHTILDYKITLTDEAGNTIERPNRFEEHGHQFRIHIIDPQPYPNCK